MQILNLKQYQYNKIYCNKVTNPAFKQKPQNTLPDEVSHIPPEQEIMDYLRLGINSGIGEIWIKIDAKDRTGKTIFYRYVEAEYVGLINSIISRPKNTKHYVINMPYNGKTPLDIAQEKNNKKLYNLLQAHDAKHYNELPSVLKELDPFYKQTQNAQHQMQEQKPPQSSNGDQAIPNPTEDARVVAAKLSIQPDSAVQRNNVSDNTKETKQTKQTDDFNFFKLISDNPDNTENSDNQPTELNNLTNVPNNNDYEETPEVPITKQRERKIPKTPDSYKNYQVLELKDDDPICIDDIIGLDNIKREFKENVITPINEQAVNVQLKANNVDIPNGILLSSVADPLSVVKATASETGMPILQVMDLESLKPMMNDVKKYYKESGVKTIILIQDIDKLFNDQTSSAVERRFHILMKDCGKKGALLIATTNNKDNVCKSFMKSGLLDKIIEVQKPTLDDRITYIFQYFGDKHLFEKLKEPNIVQEFAELMDGLNYADIQSVLDEAARTAVSNSCQHVAKELVLNELREFTEERGMTPVDKNNITGSYDTVMKRVPVTEYEPKTLDDLAGMPKIKEMLRDIYIEPLAKYDLLKANLKKPKLPDGAMFYGPPGNGKTLTAQTLSRELGLPFYVTKLSDFATSYRNEELNAIQARADQLKKKYQETGEMSVWFLDEFDSIGNSQGDNADKKMVDTLKNIIKHPEEMGCIVIVATNNPSDIDPALKRGGRIGNWIQFSNPNKEERIDLIKRSLVIDELTENLAENQEYVDKLADDLEGSSMSDIVEVIDKAKNMSVLKNQDFESVFRIALDRHIEQKLAEFCDKVGLIPHTYSAKAFKTLDELGGMEDVKQQLQKNIIDVWDPEVRQILLDNKIEIPGGVMLEGPPGTGKTTIVETLARQMDVPLYKMDYSKMRDSSYIHAVSRHVDDIFEQLKLQSKILKKPVMLFFDEAENFFPVTAKEEHELEEVNKYKTLMNTASENGIILIGATNHIHMVNQEIIGNPRRMGTVIHVGNPDDNGRKGLLEKIRDTKPLLKDVLTAAVIAELVVLTKGMSIGDITAELNKLVINTVPRKIKLNGQMVTDAFKKI